MRRAAAPLALAALVAAPAAARAGGVLVGDNGSAGMQRAGAFVAKADDPTALYYNPAGLARVARRALFLGVNLVDMDYTFDRTGDYQPQSLLVDPQPGYVGDPYPRVEHQGAAQPIPFLAVAVPAGRWAFGAGIFAPHGYAGRDFPDEVATGAGPRAPAPQRYDVISQTGLVALASAGAALRAGRRWAFGVRASWGYGTLETRRSTQALANPQEQPGLDSVVTLRGTDRSVFAWGAGAHYRGDAFELGAAYNSAFALDTTGTATVELGQQLREPLPGVPLGDLLVPVDDADARCAPGGTAARLSACIHYAMPATATIGARWVDRDRRGRERGDVELDLRWEGWASASESRAVIDARDAVLGTPLDDAVVSHNLHDSTSVRLGAARALGRPGQSTVVRGGLAYDTATQDVSWTTLDFDGSERWTLAAGVGLPAGRWRLDVGAGLVAAATRIVTEDPTTADRPATDRTQPDITVPLASPDDQPYHPFNTGVFWSRYLIASFGLSTTW